MARPGITYSEVFQAASHLIGQGKNPTIQEVRLLIGSGSSTTIANYLKQWREEQKGTQLLSTKENIPDELVAMLKGLWERVLEQSEMKVGEIERRYEARIAELEQELEKYKANNKRWQQLFGEWQEGKAKLDSQVSDLSSKVSALENEKNELKVQHKIDTQQLQEKDERIIELNRLHAQVQANLEHYRESVREERLIEQQRFEQQRQELQFEMKRLRESESILKDNLALKQNEFNLLQSRQENLEKSFAELEGELKETQVDLEASMTQKQELSILIEEQEEQLKDGKKQLEAFLAKWIYFS